MAQPTGWSPDPISDQSLNSIGSFLVPLPDIKRARQGEAMPVIVSSEAPPGCQREERTNGEMSSGGESSDEEVLRLRQDVRARIKLAKSLKRSSRSDAGSRSSNRGGHGKGSGPPASTAEPGGEPDAVFNLEEELGK